jgi:hypothetical protein
LLITLAIGLVALALVLVAVLAVLDRLAARMVARVVAGRLVARAHLNGNPLERPERPLVALAGFPFLAQVFAGRYRNVDVQVRGYANTGPRVDRVRAELDGVRLPLSELARRRVSRIVVDRVHAEVDLTFADMDAYLQRMGSVVRVRPEGDGIRVSGAVRVLGVSCPLSGTADIGVLADSVTLTPRELTRGPGAALLPPPLRAGALALLTVRFPVAGLPSNLGLKEATVHPDRLTFTAGGENVVLDTRPDGARPQPAPPPA